MEGFAVRPSPGTYVTVEPVSSLAISGAFEGDTAIQARAQFEAFMQRHGVPQADREPAVFSYGWPRAEAAEDAFIGNYGRSFDLIVLGRPGPEPENPRMPPLEAALFESGRPVLVVPQSAPRTLARNVLVAWNRSTQQARTNAFALPLLRLAEQVTVLMVEGGTDDAGHPARRRRAICAETASKPTALTVKRGTRTPGEIILEHAASLGCDLLVKSAYTQSRLRQMIFGGATRHILANAALPVLMAH